MKALFLIAVELCIPNTLKSQAELNKQERHSHVSLFNKMDSLTFCDFKKVLPRIGSVQK